MLPGVEERSPSIPYTPRPMIRKHPNIKSPTLPYSSQQDKHSASAHSLVVALPRNWPPHTRTRIHTHTHTASSIINHHDTLPLNTTTAPSTTRLTPVVLQLPDGGLLGPMIRARRVVVRYPVLQIMRRGIPGAPRLSSTQPWIVVGTAAARYPTIPTSSTKRHHILPRTSHRTLPATCIAPSFSTPRARAHEQLVLRV